MYTLLVEIMERRYSLVPRVAMRVMLPIAYVSIYAVQIIALASILTV